MKQLMSAIILSQLDHSNSILTRLPWSTIALLQRAQNTADRIVLGLSPRVHVRPALRELQHLPVIYHIKFKISLLMYLAHSHRCPSYVSHILSPVSNNPFHLRLRSSDGTMTFHAPTPIGHSVNSQLQWNTLPEKICAASDPRFFKRPVLCPRKFVPVCWFTPARRNWSNDSRKKLEKGLGLLWAWNKKHG